MGFHYKRGVDDLVQRRLPLRAAVEVVTPCRRVVGKFAEIRCLALVVVKDEDRASLASLLRLVSSLQLKSDVPGRGLPWIVQLAAVKCLRFEPLDIDCRQGKIVLAVADPSA